MSLPVLLLLLLAADSVLALLFWSLRPSTRHPRTIANRWPDNR